MGHSVSFSTFLQKSLVLIVAAAALIYIGLSAKRYSLLHPLSLNELDDPTNSTRGVIVTLIRSTDRSVYQVINMIHSVAHFHSIAPNTSYALLIFHDHNFTTHMRQQVLVCTARHAKRINISFVLINFTTSVQPAQDSRLEKSMGYRLMCRFWTYDVFYHPAVHDGHYDYLMRMDDDSYFSDTTNHDLFLYMKKKRLDYAYRGKYSESYTPMNYILRYFFGNINTVGECIYNNFFIIRLRWYYESERVQSFVWELVRDDLMLREYVGDGCAHAALVKVDREARVKQLTDFSYGHNFHLMPQTQGGTYFRVPRRFTEEMKKACRQLTVLSGVRGKLKIINMS